MLCISTLTTVVIKSSIGNIPAISSGQGSLFYNTVLGSLLSIYSCYSVTACKSI